MLLAKAAIPPWMKGACDLSWSICKDPTLPLHHYIALWICLIYTRRCASSCSTMARSSPSTRHSSSTWWWAAWECHAALHGGGGSKQIMGVASELDSIPPFSPHLPWHAATHWSSKQIMGAASELNSVPSLSPHLFTQITETPPGVKGNTASGAGTKNATLETGAVVSVPSFVEVGPVWGRGACMHGSQCEGGGHACMGASEGSGFQTPVFTDAFSGCFRRLGPRSRWIHVQGSTSPSHNHRP